MVWYLTINIALAGRNKSLVLRTGFLYFLTKDITMKKKVILVCEDGNARKAYLDHIKPHGVHVDTVSSLKELHKSLIENSYNGVMIDMKTKIRARRNEKELVYKILELYPAAQLLYDEKAGMIRAHFIGKSSGSGSIDTFINVECQSFNERSIRSNSRKKIHFNVILSKNGDFAEKSVDRAVTLDISKGGCFIYSIDFWELGSSVWLVLKELVNNQPIEGKVKWVKCWGERMQIPGFAVEFEKISKDQLVEMFDKWRVS